MDTTQSFKPNYVLVDFENVQPKNLSLLREDYFRVWIFIGPQQLKLDVDLVQAMHDFGPSRSKYLRILEKGKDALDFHIAFYLGELVTENPQAYFHIISKDKGFDPLILHLQSRNINVQRRETIADIPVLTIQKGSDISDMAEAAFTNLKARGSSRPRKVMTLKNTIANMFGNKLSDSDIEKVFRRLMSKKFVVVDGEKVSYNTSKS